MTRVINCGTIEQWIRKGLSDTLSGLRSQGPFYYHNNRHRGRFSNLTQGVEAFGESLFRSAEDFGSDHLQPDAPRSNPLLNTSPIQKILFMNSLPAQRRPVKTFLLTTTVLFVVTMAGISVAYITTPTSHFTISQPILGWLGWAALTTSTLYVSFKFKKECLIIFFIFFIFGFFSKAYLEPVSDQIDHLRRTYDKCRNIDTGERLNTGLWQYSMNSLFLCYGEKKDQYPKEKLFFLDVLHGIYITFASTILYTVSRNAGLPPKWSFLSVLIAILFMGTNKFSYFRYYSYGPSFTSLCMYWTWISAFFFSNHKKTMIHGIILFPAIIAVVSVNHFQEVIFLIFLLFFLIIIKLTNFIHSQKNNYKYLTIWTVTLFFIFFLFPQLQWIQNIFHNFINILFPFPISNLWDKNQSVVYYWNNIHIMGKVWIPQYRVSDTIGLMGLTPLILAPLLLLCNRGGFSKTEQARILLLGVLPFLILCTPLCHYIWTTHVEIPVYYRIAYSSLFWVAIVYFLYLIEMWIKKNGPQGRFEFLVKAFLCRNLFWLVCLAGVTVMATIRSPPFYGKLDFYLLDGRPWWPGWSTLITKTQAQDQTPVYTDYTTTYVLSGVFGEIPLLDPIRNRTPTLYIEDMEKNKLPEQQFLNIYLTQKDLSKDFKCVVNLIGYTSSWVPDETGHWHRSMGDTGGFYKFRTIIGEPDTRLSLKDFPVQKCAVYAPENNKE